MPKVIQHASSRCQGTCPENEARADPSLLRKVNRDKALQSSSPSCLPFPQFIVLAAFEGPLPRCPRQPCLRLTSWVKGRRLCPAVLQRVTAPPTTLSSLPSSSLSAASQLPAVCQQLLRDINNQPLAEAPWKGGRGRGVGEETEGGGDGQGRNLGVSFRLGARGSDTLSCCSEVLVEARKRKRNLGLAGSHRAEDRSRPAPSCARGLPSAGYLLIPRDPFFSPSPDPCGSIQGLLSPNY